MNHNMSKDIYKQFVTIYFEQNIKIWKERNSILINGYDNIDICCPNLVFHLLKTN